MVKDAIPAFDGSLYFVHVVLLICLDVGLLAQCFFVVNWSVAFHKRFDLRNMECGVSFPFMGERWSYHCGGDELLNLEWTDEFVVQFPRGPSEFEVGG